LPAGCVIFYVKYSQNAFRGLAVGEKHSGRQARG